jgi:hypothetical protein
MSYSIIKKSADMFAENWKKIAEADGQNVNNVNNAQVMNQ